MSWEEHVLCVVLAASLTALQVCNGQSEAAEQRPSAAGSVSSRTVKHGYVAPTRHGSPAFQYDEHGTQKPTHVSPSLMDAKLRRMNPSVQCSDDLMTLKVKLDRAPHFLVDSGEGQLIPLSQMPSKCGFSVKRSRRDVLFVAPYQGCHVTQQGGNYVLPLRLRGAPMTMSCPAASPPPSAICFATGMVVKIAGITANELKVKVTGMWKSLLSVCSSCGLGVEVLSGGLVITAPYNRGLCIESEDEKYLFSLLLADVELRVMCPSFPDIQPSTTTTTTDGGQAHHYPQYPQIPQFPQYPVFPVPTTPAQTPAPTTVAPLTQRPQKPYVAATEPDSKKQQAPAVHYPAFPFMPPYHQFPQIPQYPVFPVPTTPAQTPAPTTVAPLTQRPQKPYVVATEPDSKKQQAPAVHYPAIPFMPPYHQFPQIPQYPVFPVPTTPAQTPAPTTVTPLTQRPQKPYDAATEPDSKKQAPAVHYPAIPFMPPYHQFPQIPQYPVFPVPTTPAQTPAPTTVAPLTQRPQKPYDAATEPDSKKQAPAVHYPAIPFMPPYQFPQIPQYPVFPVPTTPAQTPAPSTVAPLTQHPQKPYDAATEPDSKKQAPAVHYPAIPFMPPYHQFPQYPPFPRPVSPTQSTANKNTAAPPVQLTQMSQAPQYWFPGFPQFPMAPGIFHPTTPNPPTTSTEALVTTPAPNAKHHVPQQPQFPVQYPSLPFPNLLRYPEAPALDPKPEVQQPKPHHVHPQTYPVLYPPHEHPSQRQNPPTAAQKPSYYPHPHAAADYAQPHAPLPVFADPPANPAPSDQHEHQPVYHAMHPFYHYPSHQGPKLAPENL